MSQNLAFTPIPYGQLSEEALQGVIESFINREGTDYGHEEFSFTQKYQQVMGQIQSGEAVIVFDHDTQSVGIMHKDQLS
ncbi:YheU family protein [Oceaniserpentilla sp. 4NH20-0058]|uniref:YheU family protein n=1 Tax=Oceaniserpentilla sp. 4NH20-0058 TaxID=3127660 RepID=UPI00310A5719